MKALLLALCLAFACECAGDNAGATVSVDVGATGKSSVKAADPAVDCADTNPHCTGWAARGECSANPAYMNVECAHSCKTCDMRDARKRCPRNASVPQVYQPYEMGAMFRRIQQGEWDQYGPIEVHSTDPWIVTFDNFITAEEADQIIALFRDDDYERSTNVGGMDSNGRFTKSVDSSRTSENAWCQQKCATQPVMVEIANRVHKVTGVPPENCEYLQMLRYRVGNQYKTHHDYIPAHKDFPFGPRILTFFLYLSDVEAGGETQFTSLNLKVKPKKGRALLWPSVLDDRPLDKDVRTSHAALPVQKGVKFAGNLWLHAWDFRTPHGIGCAP